MKKISFNTANYVAQTSNYQIFSEEWMEGDASTNGYFKPLETYEERFDALVSKVRELGFDYMDLWTAHCNWAWATPEHLNIANKVVNKYNIQILSYVGEFGSTEKDFINACRLVKALGFDLMGGGSSFYVNNRDRAVEILQEEGVRFAFENHPNEKAPEDILRLIDGTPKDVVGATIDTGWFATYGIEADEAIKKLSDRVMHVHLKDIEAHGAHDTCAYDEGCVPLYNCVKLLEDNGYTGSYSIEHEPYTFDPSEDCVKSKELLEKWLQEVNK